MPSTRRSIQGASTPVERCTEQYNANTDMPSQELLQRQGSIGGPGKQVREQNVDLVSCATAYDSKAINMESAGGISDSEERTTGDTGDSDYVAGGQAKKKKKAGKAATATTKKRGRQGKDDSETPQTKKSRQDQDEVDASKPKTLRQVSLPTEIQQFETGSQALVSKFMANQEKVEELETELRLLKAKLNQGHEAIKRHVKAISNLERRESELKTLVSILQDRNERSQQANDAKRSRIAQLLQEAREDTSGCVKVADSTIDAMWHHLLYKVQGLVYKFLQGNLTQPTEGFSSKTVREAFFNSTKLPRFKAFYLQQCIWRMLLSHVFNAKGGLWAGRIGESLTAYCHDVQEQLLLGIGDVGLYEKLSLSKAQAAGQIDEAYGINKDALNLLAMSLAKDLEPFMRPSDLTNFQMEAVQVLNIALKLHIIFMKSRAFFKLTLPLLEAAQPPSAPDNERMELYFKTADTPDQGLRVHFIVTPVLEKAGNADGEALDLQMVVCKARYVARSSESAWRCNETTTAMGMTVRKEDQSKSLQLSSNGDVSTSQAIPTPKPMAALKKEVWGHSQKDSGRSWDRSQPRAFVRNHPYDETPEVENPEGASEPEDNLALVAFSCNPANVEDDDSSSTIMADKPRLSSA